MKKKIIIYTGGFEMPDKNPASHRVSSNAKIFQNIGYEIIYIGLSKDIDSVKMKIHHGSKSYLIPHPKGLFSWAKHITSIKKTLNIISDIDTSRLEAIICYNYPAISMRRLQFFCKKNNVLHISDTTEWYSSKNYKFLRRIIKSIDVQLRMRYFQTFSDGIITPGKYLTDYYSKKGKEIVEIPTLFDFDTPLNFNNDDKIKFIFAGSPFNGLTLKDRSSTKERLDKIVILFSELAKNNNNFILDIYGLTESDYLKVYPEHLKLLNLNKTFIIFNGKVNHSEIISKISLSDFSIFMRNIDRTVEAGFPTKFSESITLGTPIICNKISSFEKFMIEGKNSFELDKDSIKNQVNKMETILSLSKKNIHEMKTYSKKSEIFHYKNYIQKVNKFLDSINIYSTK